MEWQNSLRLIEHEEEILEAFENGELKPNNPHTDFQAIARNTLKKETVRW